MCEIIVLDQWTPNTFGRSRISNKSCR